ncbi:MAG: hypothetical protein A2033_17380 [Bacteroidetes bacterium GWA2_31_9]|nr:MAG: hypothetical protein A2033_17380 [Bacteroidetes bacterium GWA2_31_9]
MSDFNISINKNKVEFLKFNFLFFRVILISLMASSFFSSCKKDTDLGLTTQPAGDKINTVFADTLSIEAYTLKDDSATSKNEAYGMLGNYNDPEFGNVSASFLAQVLSKVVGTKFESSSEVVSIKLYLDYSGNYGDSTKTQTINVYKLTNSIVKDSAYYSFNKASSFYNESDLLGSRTINQGQLYSDNLGIDLLPSLGNSIFSLDSIKANSDILSVLPGICITTDTNVVGGGIAYFNLTSGNSKIVLTYKNASSDTVTSEFIINQNCARFNLFTHDYSNTNFYGQMNSITPIQDSVFYIQPMAGVRGYIKLPTADKLNIKSNVAIVKATLVIPIEKNDLSISTYEAPTKLMLYERQANNQYKLPPDFSLGEIFDGNYYPSESVYKFNITLEMQNIIDGVIPNLGLYLISNDISSCNRVVLTSGIHSNRLKLEISYIKF